MDHHPDHQRAPRCLTPVQAREALTELDSKLDTLRRRAQATAAPGAADTPTHTYHQHIAVLERKRELLQETYLATTTAPVSITAWAELLAGIDTLRQEAKKLLD